MFEFLKASVYALIIYPGIACILSLVLTRLCIGLLPRAGFVDMPDARRVHRKPTPRGGGIAIIAAFFLTSVLYVERHASAQMGGFVAGFALPAFVIVVCGLLDDRFSLASRTKLVIQILAGVLVWVVGARLKFILSVELPDYLALPLTVLWVVTIVNAFNLIDGMDGVAAGLGFLSAVCLGLWGGLQNSSAGLVAIAFILAGSCAGFLRYNFSPASIFMGDTGSMFLGLFFAYAGLTCFGKPATLTSLLIPVLAVGVPLFDVALAFWRRLVRKLLDPSSSGIMTADMFHLHHRILKQVSSQRKAAIRIYLLACLLAGMGFVVLLFEQTIPALGYMALLLILLLVVRRIAGVELYDSARLLKEGISRPRKLLLILLAVPAVDLLVLFVADLAARRLLHIGFHEFWYDFVCIAAPIPLLFLISGSYRVLWLRAGYEEFRQAAELTLTGLIIGSCLFAFFCDKFDREQLPAYLVLFSLLAAFGIGFVRFVLVYLGMRMMWQLRQTGVPGVRNTRVLLYGGGLNATLYLNYVSGCATSENMSFIGIVDDDPALAGMRVFGLPVLGFSADLERILARYSIDKIVLTVRRTSPEREAHVLSIAERAGVSLCRFQAEELRIGDFRVE
ncbi:hypothetical protein FYJ85_16140 [Victivallaceae bacterium BBE-744-WT-12]|uniref:UDP-GlcNAc:undecaprenyl-phosphate GlcNAc-1-phosphate transferase n=1 Tax=Victivallis lenta TaxID=2606640 RepID=A0A844G8F9_9BACT|nr:hypothetical protein [Victivallis lenta]AVM45559.1 hypothetical protein C5Q97_12960 [Victivallales bacterium CCUG 44730]MBS1453429.1 hypothetical protein [Lentisphaeria bacterium]MBS5529970.1 hypothetical protein [bacterium]MST98569.1 hypothetical protein [Victivallis lenta]